MACGSSQTPNCLPCGDDDATCIQAQPVLPPARCSDDANTKGEGPPGDQGETGDTPTFVIGTVTEGEVAVTLVENTPTSYTVNFVVPNNALDTANTWSAVQTFEQQAVFDLGLTTTGGTSTFGGTAFVVTPDASFAGNVTVAGNETVTGTLGVTGDATVAGSLTVAGTSIFAATQINGEVTFGSGASIIAPAATAGSFPRGILVLNSCNKPQLLPNRGGSLYQKSDATGLNTIASGGDGALSNAFTVNVPVSSCLPQVTPVITVMARVGYTTGAAPNGAFTARLWKTAVTTGTKLDEFTVGVNTFDNTNGGCLILEGRTTLTSAGNTSFFVEVDNNTTEDFVPQQVTFWATN